MAGKDAIGALRTDKLSYFPRCSWIAVPGVLCLVIAAGCQQRPVSLPHAKVTGTVLVDDAPLEKGIVVFLPEPADPQRAMVTGDIREDGTYEMAANDKDGVALGRYKVTVFTGRVGKQSSDAPFAPRYSTRESPLLLEVAENAGPEAYVLKLTKN